MHAVVIYNPVSGRGLSERFGARAEERLQAAGYGTELVATRPAGGALDVAAEIAPRADLVVVVGGDGSLRETLTGLGETSSRIRLALVPMGNANVIARELGIPLDPDAAVEAITSGRDSKLDVGVVRLRNACGDDRETHQLFLGMVGVGWDALVVRRIGRIRRSALGRRWYGLWADSVYFIAGVLAVFRLHPRQLRLAVDARQRSQLFRAALVCNTRTYGKGWSMAPRASASSGQLEVQARKRSLLPWLLWHLLAAMFSRASPRFISGYFNAASVKIEAERAFPVQIDGDDRGDATHLELSLRSSPALIVVPE